LPPLNPALPTPAVDYEIQARFKLRGSVTAVLEQNKGE